MLHADQESLKRNRWPLGRLDDLSAFRGWRAILDAIPQMVWSVAADGSDEYFNRQWLEFTGVAVGESNGPSRLSLVHPDDRDRASAAWQHSLATGEEYEAEYRLRHRTGEYRWLLSRGRPERDARGHIVGWYGSCTDIHERQLAREALNASEERLRLILDSMPQIVWSSRGSSTDPDFYNKRWYEFTGLPAGSMGGAEWAELYHREDRSAAAAAWHTSCATGDPYECEYRLRDASGNYRWIVSRGLAERDAAGNIVRWYGACTDINERVLARLALLDSERRIQTILDSVPQVIWSARPDGGLDYVSGQWEMLYGSTDGRPLGSQWLEVIHCDDQTRAQVVWQHSLDTGDPFEIEFRVLHRSGQYLWTLARALPERSPAGEIVHWYGTCTDIHDQVVAQQALHSSETLIRGIIEASPDCVALLDLAGNVLSVNQATLRAQEAGVVEDLLGTRWVRWYDRGCRRRADRALAAAQAGRFGRFLLGSVKGPPRWWDVIVVRICDEGGKPMNLVAISRDVTHQKRAEEKVRWTANHDALTGLPNRLLLQQRIDETVKAAASSKGQFALLLLDIDHFKRINDTLGHDAGDALLCTFAERLKAGLRPDDTIARLGGDEFAIVLAGVGDEQQVRTAVDAILADLSEPCLHDGRMLDCRASIGASLYPVHGETRNELLKNADVALYAAKAAGRANLKLFRPDMRFEMQRRSSMLSLARSALAEDRIRPFYQPKIDLRTGQLAGFEALLRWSHPIKGIQMPETVAAAFEDMTLAAEISERMIGRVIEDLKHWRAEGIEFGHVAVNAAAAEFRRGDFAERVLERLSAASVDVADLQIEITETVFLGRGADYVERALKLLSASGVKIALDDFGTGYASLSHLKQFPVDIIKIDRSFVRDFENDPDDSAIINAVIQLGRSLGIKVVAEGIETTNQHQLLCAGGCDYGQGYLYGKATPFLEVPATIKLCAERHALHRAGGGLPTRFLAGLPVTYPPLVPRS